MSSAAAARKAAHLKNQQNSRTGNTGEEKKAGGLGSITVGSQMFPKKELIKFARGMGSMLRAQINTADALRFYAQGHPNVLVKNALLEARQMIEAGAPAYVAFQKTKKFDDKFVTLVRAGSDSGQLGQAFTAIGLRLKKEGEFGSKMKKATILPSIIIVVLLMLFVGAQIKIVPEVEGILDDVGQEPDPFSGFMFTVSHVTKKVYPFFFGILFGGIACVALIPKVRNFVLNMAMSKWRLLRRLVMGMRQMLFLGTLNMLHSNGITLAKSVQIAADSISGTPMQAEMIEAGQKYQLTGLPFSEAIKKFTSCDSQVAHMISIGERSSSLGSQLTMLTEMYEEDVDQMINEFAAAINFLSLVMACLLISAVFIGAFLPIFLMGPKMMAGGGM